MPRQFFTADDIRRLAQQRADSLTLAPGDIVTQEAQDVASALGVRLVQGTEADVSSRNKRAAVRIARLADASMEPFTDGEITPGTNAWGKEAFAARLDSTLSVSYMSLDKGAAQRIVQRDEAAIVLEGELIVTCGSEWAHGKSGDVIYISAGATAAFETPNWTRFVRVTLNR
ncbi:MAG: cupin domain-containing protein [Anaerolineaceae bacterium]|nr:cupin domain-containing protein [Anaerolineaceae bacterium]